MFWLKVFYMIDKALLSELSCTQIDLVGIKVRIEDYLNQHVWLEYKDYDFFCFA